MKFFFSLITLFILSGSAFANLADSSRRVPTATLPEVTVKDVDGKNINLGDYGRKGELTVISFWATWCKPCILELKNIDLVLEEWTEKYGVSLVAVSVDDARNSMKVKPFVTGQGWTFDILMDPNGDLQRALNVTNPPMTFLINKEGKIAYMHSGYLPGDEFELEKEIIKWSK